MSAETDARGVKVREPQTDAERLERCTSYAEVLRRRAEHAEQLVKELEVQVAELTRPWYRRLWAKLRRN